VLPRQITDLKSVDPKGSCGFESRHRHHLKSEASLRQTKLAPFVKEFLKAKEEGKTSKKRRKAKPRYLGTLRYRLELLRDYLPDYSLEDLEPEHLTDFLESRQISGRTWKQLSSRFPCHLWVGN